MITFQADIMIDGFNAGHVKKLLSQVSYITDAIVSEVETYRDQEGDYPFKDTVTQGVKFKATFALLKMPDEKQLKAHLENCILCYFTTAREIWCECYCLDPEPPHIDFTKRHPRQMEWNKKRHAKRKAWFEDTHSQRSN